MKIQLNNCRTALLIMLLYLASACSSNTQQGNTDDGTVATSDTALKTKELQKAKKIIYALPSPHEVASLLIEQSNTRFNESLLNSLKNLSLYSTNRSMAMNLGIYSADISYASVYDQNQIVINYMATAKKLAKSLGILDVVGEGTVNQLKDNINNRDAIVNILTQTFMNSDSYLKDNERHEVAAMIVVGGWLEGLYLATQLTGKSVTKNPKLVGKIIDQSLSHELMLNMLTDYRKDKDISMLLTEMQSIKPLYDKLQTSVQGKDASQTDGKVFKDFCDNIEKIRNDYVKLN